MVMHVKPRQTCWFQHNICWFCTSLLVPTENLLVLCNKFGFDMLNSFSAGSKRFVLVCLGFDAFPSSVFFEMQQVPLSQTYDDSSLSKPQCLLFRMSSHAWVLSLVALIRLEKNTSPRTTIFSSRLSISKQFYLGILLIEEYCPSTAQFHVSFATFYLLEV